MPRTASVDFSDEVSERMRRISRIDYMEGESAYPNCHPERQRARDPLSWYRGFSGHNNGREDPSRMLGMTHGLVPQWCREAVPVFNNTLP